MSSVDEITMYKLSMCHVMRNTYLGGFLNNKNRKPRGKVFRRMFKKFCDDYYNIFYSISTQRFLSSKHYEL